MISTVAMWWWGGVAMAVVAACGVVWAVGSDWWATRKLRKAGTLRRCRKCLFDMSGLTTLVCPECGKKAKSEKVLRSVRRRWGVAVLCSVLMSASCLVSTWARIRATPLSDLSTEVAVSLPLVMRILRVERIGDNRRYQYESEAIDRYRRGVVTSRCETIVFALREIQVLPAKLQAWNEDRSISKSQLDLQLFVPKDYFQKVIQYPELEVVWKRGSSDLLRVRAIPQNSSMTLEESIRASQYSLYDGLRDRIRLFACGDSWSLTEFDLSNLRLIVWSDPRGAGIVQAISEELIAIQAMDCAVVGDFKYSRGKMVGDEMVRIYAWHKTWFGDEFERFVIRTIEAARWTNGLTDARYCRINTADSWSAIMIRTTAAEQDRIFNALDKYATPLGKGAGLK